ncbi:hypothetical protein [Sphingomonas yabuuchiae]|uniref:hypothetical protein n=1 Tax=Sphingomonas yabuuchiae TaxID=172044 RepID=UPI003D972002
MARSTLRRPTKRSPIEWAVRGFLAVTALTVGYASTKATLAFAVYRNSPERAFAFAPHNGRIAGALAEQIAASDADARQRTWATYLARQALEDEPLSTSALTALALNTQIAGNTPAARKLFLHSNALSRRELGTRLWLIEDAVNRNDVNGALHHYDVALRTAKASSDLLFPVLLNAISDPAIVRSLANTLAKRPPWGDAFIQYLSDKQSNPLVGAVLLQRLGALGYPVPGTAQASVINGLVAKGSYADAWRYYVSLHSGATRNQSRDSNFTAQLQSPSAFDWTAMLNDSGINASFQRTGRGGVFEFAAPSTVGGVALQQVQLLSPGHYRLEGVSMDIEQAREAQPYWQLSCIDGRELGRVEIPNSAEMQGRFAGELTVQGANCAAQTLRLVLRASSDVNGVTGQIKRVLLAPMGGKH